MISKKTHLQYRENAEMTACEKMNKMYIYMSKETFVYTKSLKKRLIYNTKKNAEMTACEKKNKIYTYLSKEMCVHKQGPRMETYILHSKEKTLR